jgi:D-amino-acid dehydrogenase
MPALALKWLLNPSTSPFSLRLSLQPAYLSWLLHFALACSQANLGRAIPALNALGQLSAKNFAELIAAENFDCAYQQSGLLFLFKTAAALEDARHEADILHRHSLPAEVLDQAAVHQREPCALPEIIGGVHYTGDASLNPARFLQLLAGRVRALGAEIHENSPLTGWESSAGKLTRVRAGDDEYAPQLTVLAAGAWSPVVAHGLGLNLPVQPARGYSLTLRAPQSMPRQALLLGEPRVAVTPMGDLLRFTGRLELSRLDTTVSSRHIAGIQQAVREYIQLDPQLEITETWAGLRPTTPDGLPIIGFSPKHSNLLIATGHAMLGLSLGPATGQLVAELANGAPASIDLRPLRLERFN